MPPQIRYRLQLRQNQHTMNTTMRGYIAPYTPHTGRGSDTLHVKPWNWRNSRMLADVDRERLKRFTLFTCAHNTIHFTGNTLHFRTVCVLLCILVHYYTLVVRYCVR